ncbi:sugar phosphate isomerase/epimerase [bacterium]|nr:sugar phosphate isomerase/epimerase [bacterium]
MKIGISQLIAGNISTDEFLQAAKSNGYEAVELSLKREGPITPQTPAEELDSIRDRARENGLELVSLTLNHLTGNLLDSGEAQRIGIDETRHGLEMAARLGARCCLHTLGQLRPDLFYDDAYANAISALRELATTAKEFDMAIAVEFVWNGFLFSPLETRHFLEEIGSPHIGFYFDPGNMAIFQYPHHWVRILGPHIKMVHMKDWKGRALKGEWTPLLQGEVDFKAVMAELRTAGYQNPLISEVPPTLAPFDQTAQAIRQIRDAG